MLFNSFVFLDGIGTMRETSFWRAGVLTWDDFLRAERMPKMSQARKSSIDNELAEAKVRLARSDSAYFASRFPRREHWRCLGEFGRSVAYLDIETTGISPRSPITLVGVYDGSRMHTLVRGLNLDARTVRAILSSTHAIVTFNGASFDLPMLESQFPGSIPDIPHVDLKHPLAELGLTGGLKRIEREMGILRDKRVEYMTGEDAVYLWRLWEKKGNGNALELLTEYNAADCRNLQTLARHAYTRLRQRGFEASAGCRKA